MDIQEIYELGLAQGWDEDDAFYLAQIAWAESEGDVNNYEYLPDNPPNEQYSFGLWQINLQHVPQLMEAGIGDWSEVPLSDDWADDPDLWQNIINNIRNVLADPVTNAEAAWYVGHRMDYSEPWDDWDWTRWNVTKLPETDGNHPSNFGSDVTRIVSEEPAVEGGLPAGLPDFDIPEMERLMTPVYGGGPGGGVVESPLDPPLYPDLTYGQLEFWTNHFAQGDAYDFDGEENMIAAEFMQSKMAETEFDINTGHDDFKASGDYARAIRDFDTHLGGLGWEIEYKPLGWSWMWLWGRENEEVKDFLDDWVQRFNDSRNSMGGVDEPAKWNDDVLLDNFMNHPVGGLNAQDWWMNRTGDWENAQRLWYESQPSGGPIWSDEFPDDYMEMGIRYGEGEGLVEGYGGNLPGDVPPGWFMPGGADEFNFALEPGSSWGNAWQQTKTMVRTTIENMGIDLAGRVSETFVNRMTMELMQNGGATFALGGRDASQWSEEATMMIEAGIREEYLGVTAGEGAFIDMGPGRFQDIVDLLTNRYRQQMMTVTPDMEAQIGLWAMDILGGEEAMGTLNLSQRLDEIDSQAWNEATGTFGLTAEDLAALGAGVSTDSYGNRTGGTIRGLLQPLANAANTVWGSMADYKVDDQWLIDNYMVTDEQGTRRRNATEMANQARTNRSRFSQSDEYQDWGNKFMAGAAAMFRSDY